MKKRLGVALAGAVLAAGFAGGSGFAVHTPGPNTSPAHLRHCTNIRVQIADLYRRQALEPKPARKAALGRQITALEARWYRQCVIK
jgi:hypothetical protein